METDDISLPINKGSALRRLLHIENQMAENAHFRQIYHENIQKYLKKRIYP